MILPSRSGRAALMALAAVFGLPALASAQLFPNLPIRRERPDCSQENPQYKMIRQEYWGYYPTCWRRFPPGWGCPSPEAPNWEQAQRELPVKLPDDPSAALPDGSKPMTDPPSPFEGDAKPADNRLPALPNGTSPFDEKPAPPAGIDPPPAGRATDPFEGPPPATRPGGATPPGLASPPDLPPTAARTAPRPRRSVVAGLFGNRRR